MIEYATVHIFAVKWFEKFRNPNTYHSEIADHMGNECAALDFTEDATTTLPTTILLFGKSSERSRIFSCLARKFTLNGNITKIGQ